jgi:hypothetical protein
MLIGGDDVSDSQAHSCCQMRYGRKRLLANNTLLGRRGVTRNKLLTSYPDLPPTTKDTDVELELHSSEIVLLFGPLSAAHY